MNLADYELVVIGSGPGGQKGAIAAKLATQTHVDFFATFDWCGRFRFPQKKRGDGKFAGSVCLKVGL